MRQASINAIAGLAAAALLAPALAAAAGAAGAEHVTIGGYVRATAAQGFTIESEGLLIRVNMERWGWQQDYAAFENSAVVVSAPLRHVDFRSRSLRPDAVYIGSVDTYYRLEDDSSVESYVMKNAPSSGFAWVRATVQSVEGGKLGLEDALVAIDTSRLNGDMAAQLHAGDRVVVRGPADAEFWTRRRLRAARVEPLATGR